MALLRLLLMITASGGPSDCDGRFFQAAVTQCEADRLHHADAALNTEWLLSLAAMHRRDRGLQDPRSIPPSYTDALVEAQRAWLTFRDADCRVAGYRARGGTLEPTLELRCKTRLTQARTMELRDQVRGY